MPSLKTIVSSVILPLQHANGRLEALRNWYSFAWRAIGSNGELLAGLANDLRKRTHRVTVWPVPDEDGSATLFADAFRRAGWQVRVERCDENHVLHVDGRSFAEYWQGRPGRMRTTLKRKAKKVDVQIFRHFKEAAWQHYEDIYAESWKPGEGAPALLRAFACAEGDAGRIRLAIAMHGHEAVAAQFWTVENGTAYIHKLAHREAHANLSAGTTLSAALFEHAMDKDGVELIDFGTGNDRYKADWMETVRPRFVIDCLDPRQPSAWPALAKLAAVRLRRRLA